MIKDLAVKAAHKDFTSPAWQYSMPELIDVRENANGTWSMYVNHLDLDYGNGLRMSKWYRIQTAACWVE